MQINLNFMIQITSHKEEKGGIKSSVLSLLTTVKSFEADISGVSPLSERRTDARNVSFETLYGGQFTLSTLLMKPKLPCYSPPPTRHHSFFRNFTPLWVWFVRIDWLVLWWCQLLWDSSSISWMWLVGFDLMNYTLHFLTWCTSSNNSQAVFF